MTLARIRKGDTVVVLAGRDRGKRGTVRAVLPRAGKALVQDVNVSKRHLRATNNTQQAGIVDKELPITLSNLAPIDPKTNKPTRIRTRILTSGKRVRLALSGEQIGNAKE